ncbi:MAG: hypothetical protein NT159_08075 [Proteobacteria bacterium]|nr:hypothetical protein [Pseudomonadota bacterium]
MSDHKLDLWKQRDARIRKALAFEPVDRVPFTFLGPAYAPRSQGMPFSTFCTDADAAVNVTLDTLDSLDDVDGINMMVAGLFPVHLTNQWLSRIDIPGRELPDGDIWQVHEEAVMSVADYDMIIDKGWPAFLDYIYPKVHKPDLLAKHNAWMQENYADTGRRYHERGYATLCSMITTIPFEALCGARSMTQFFFDCYRMPAKVKAALDVIQPFYVDLAVQVTNISGIKSCWVGGWRSASAMVSPKIWNEFVFPYFFDLITKLHAQGILCVLHFDQKWDRDLKRFLELPKGSCVFAPDGATNIRLAREVLGNHMPLLGDVPAGLLAAGSPDDVHKYVRELIRDLGPAGLIMNSGCDTPYNTPRANMDAFVAATHEYGTCAH